MTMTSIPDAFPSAGQARIHAATILCSILAGQTILLLKLSARGNLFISIALLSLLCIVFSGGCFLAQFKVLQRKSLLPRLCQGFLISAAGMVLLLAASRELHSWLSLLPGIIISGLGQGIVCTAVIKGCKKEWHKWHTPIYMSAMLIIGPVLSVTAVVLLQSRFTGMTGFPYAFALLADLSLLGALYVKIIESDR
ncbi:MAG: hypothetical protein ACOH2G_07640 [Ewingella sp.]